MQIGSHRRRCFGLALGSCVWFKLRAAYADIAFCVSKEPARYLCKVLCRSSIFWGLMACWMPCRTQMPAASALIGGGPLGLFALTSKRVT